MTPGKHHDRRLVLWLSLAQLITWGSIFYTFSLLLEPVERELNMTRAQSSLAFSLGLLAEGLAAYPVGRWIDSGHERAVMTAGSILAGLCMLAHGFITNAAGFYAVWAGLGLALAATLYTPVFAVITRRFPDDFRRAIITMTFLGGLASTVFIPLSAWLVAHFGWRHAVEMLAMLQLAFCAPIHFVQLKGAPRATAHAHPDLPPAGAYARSMPFLLIGVFTVGMMAVAASLPPHMIALLRGSGLPEYWVIAIPASIGILQVAGRLLLFVFEKHFDVHVANRTIPALIPVALVTLLIGVSSPVGAMLFVLLFGMGNGMMTIVKGTAIAQYVSREHVASLNGALGLPQAIARAFMPWLVGALWSAQAGYTWGIVTMLATSIVAALALVLAQRMALSHQRLGASRR